MALQLFGPVPIFIQIFHRQQWHVNIIKRIENSREDRLVGQMIDQDRHRLFMSIDKIVFNFSALSDVTHRDEYLNSRD